MDKIIHGLDLPEEVSEKNNEIMMQKLEITEEEIISGLNEIED